MKRFGARGREYLIVGRGIVGCAFAAAFGEFVELDADREDAAHPVGKAPEYLLRAPTRVDARRFPASFRVFASAKLAGCRRLRTPAKAT